VFGLGELKQEVVGLITDLREVDCDMLTIGQYLQPSLRHHKVVRYVPPEEFAGYRKTGERMGFKFIASAPLVRSSFHAEEAFLQTVPESDNSKYSNFSISSLLGLPTMSEFVGRPHYDCRGGARERVPVVFLNSEAGACFLEALHEYISRESG
jgi:hypothetical protein